MKKLGFLLFLTLNFNSYAGVVSLSDKECNDITVDSSIVAYSSDNNLALFMPYKLNKGVGAKYMDTQREAVNKDLKKYCESNKGVATLGDFKKAFYSSCGYQCGKNTDVFDKPIFGGLNKSQEEAATVCVSICNKTYAKLEALEQGARLASKESKDCTGAVESTSRSNSKLPIIAPPESPSGPSLGSRKLPLMAAPVQPR